MALTPLRLQSWQEPHDQRLEVLARLCQVGVAIGTGLWVAQAGLSAWAPVPLLTSTLGWELSPSRRRSRPVEVTFGDSLSIADPRRGRAVIDLDRTVAIVRHWRSLTADRDEVCAVLYDAQDVQICLTFRSISSPARFDGSDTDALERCLGGMPGWRGSLASDDARVDRPLRDPQGGALAILRERLGLATWSTLAARLWYGPNPPLDPSGRHLGPPSAILCVDARGWRSGTGPAGPLDLLTIGRHRRTQPVRAADGSIEDIDMDALAIGLVGGLTLALPTPAAAALAPLMIEDPSGLAWLHASEGAPLLQHLAGHARPSGAQSTLAALFEDESLPQTSLPPQADVL